MAAPAADIQPQPVAAQPAPAPHVQVGEPNCMHSVAALIRAGFEGGTMMKVITFVLILFAALIAGATIVGIIPTFMTAQEYLRQDLERDINDSHMPRAIAQAQQDEARIATLEQEGRNKDMQIAQANDEVARLTARIDAIKTKLTNSLELHNWKRTDLLPGEVAQVVV